MAESYINSQIVTKESLMVLHNNLCAANEKNIVRKYDNKFAQTGAKTGDTLTIRKPPLYQVKKQIAFAAQNYEEPSVQLKVDQVAQVPCSWSAHDLTLNMDDFSGRFVRPAVVPLANDVDLSILGLYKQVWNVKGTPGSIPSADTPFLNIRDTLVYQAAVDTGFFPLITSPTVNSAMSSALGTRFNDRAEVSGQYKKGRMGTALGFEWMVTQNVRMHTTGAFGSSAGCTVNGALNDGATQITLAAASNSVSGWIKEGDVFQIENVYEVNPITKESTGVLKNFVATADADSSGGGAVVINFQPPVYHAATPKQNASAQIAHGAVVYIYGVAHATSAGYASVASKQSAQNMTWAQEAVTLAMVDIERAEDGSGVKQTTVRDEDLGLSMMLTERYAFETLSKDKRLDILYGRTLLRPEHVGRVAA